VPDEANARDFALAVPDEADARRVKKRVLKRNDIIVRDLAQHPLRQPCCLQCKTCRAREEMTDAVRQKLHTPF
jgi:hypothetical protein